MTLHACTYVCVNVFERKIYTNNAHFTHVPLIPECFLLAINFFLQSSFLQHTSEIMFIIIHYYYVHIIYYYYLLPTEVKKQRPVRLHL